MHLSPSASIFAPFLCILPLVACGGAIDVQSTSDSNTGNDGVGEGNSGKTGKGGSATKPAPSCGSISASPVTIGPGRDATEIVATPQALYWCELANRIPNGRTGVVRWDRTTKAITPVSDANCSALVIDSDWLYWTEPSRRLGRASRDGSVVQALFSSPPPNNTTETSGWYGMAIDAQSAYWKDFGSNGGIYQGSKEGGAMTKLADESYVGAVAVDDEAVFWGTKDGIKRWSKSSHELTILTDSTYAAAVDGHNIDVDDTYVYWGSTKGIERTPKRGGKTERMFTGEERQSVGTLSIQAGCLYFGAGTGLWRMPLTGGQASLLRTSSLDLNIFWYAADELGVYWGEWEGYEAAGNVYMLPQSP